MNYAFDFYRQYGAMQITLIAAVFFLAGGVKGIVGLGLPTVAMGLLGLTMAPPQAAALLVVPAMVTNIWQLAIGGNFVQLLRRLLPVMVAVCIGTWAGTALWGKGAMNAAGHALGVAILIYAIVGLMAPTFHLAQRHERWLGPIVGVLTGLVTSVTGVFVIPIVPYLQSLSLDRNQLVQAMGLTFSISTFSLAMSLLWTGDLGGPQALASLAMVAPALIGMAVGQAIRHRVSAQTFKRIFFIGLACLAIHLIWVG